MSIIQNKENIKTEPTTEEVVRGKYNNIVDLNKDFYTGIRKFLELQFNLIFNDEHAQEILNEFGTNAQDLILKAKELQDIAESVDENYVRLEVPENVVINEDGTITVS